MLWLELRKQGALSKGVPLSNGGQLMIVYEHGRNGNGHTDADEPKFSNDSVDNRILTLAYQIKKKSKVAPLPSFIMCMAIWRILSCRSTFRSER